MTAIPWLDVKSPLLTGGEWYTPGRGVLLLKQQNVGHAVVFPDGFGS